MALAAAVSAGASPAGLPPAHACMLRRSTTASRRAMLPWMPSTPAKMVRRPAVISSHLRMQGATT